MQPLAPVPSSTAIVAPVESKPMTAVAPISTQVEAARPAPRRAYDEDFDEGVLEVPDQGEPLVPQVTYPDEKCPLDGVFDEDVLRVEPAEIDAMPSAVEPLNVQAAGAAGIDSKTAAPSPQKASNTIADLSI